MPSPVSACTADPFWVGSPAISCRSVAETSTTDLLLPVALSAPAGWDTWVASGDPDDSAGADVLGESASVSDGRSDATGMPDRSGGNGRSGAPGPDSGRLPVGLSREMAM
jgi:hypothetical protein